MPGRLRFTTKMQDLHSRYAIYIQPTLIPGAVIISLTYIHFR